jgi:hypothetical protein
MALNNIGGLKVNSDAPVMPSACSSSRDLCRIAAWRGEVDVYVRRGRIGEKPLDHRLQLPPIDEFPYDRHGVGVEVAHCQGAAT